MSSGRFRCRTVEFHPWNSRRADTEKPDEWRIDLDPMPLCDFARVRRVAHVAHEVLDELGATGWPKTSGGNGLHIYVRIEPRWGFQDVRRAALAFAREVERRAPDLVTTAWWRRTATQDQFIDYNQNARDHTIACAYSVRGNARDCLDAGEWARSTMFSRTTSPSRPCRRGMPTRATCMPASMTPSSTSSASCLGRPRRARRPRRASRAAGVTWPARPGTVRIVDPWPRSTRRTAPT